MTRTVVTGKYTPVIYSLTETKIETETNIISLSKTERKTEMTHKTVIKTDF